MSLTLDQIPRAEKVNIARALHQRLSARFQKGPPEGELDDYLPQLLDIVRRLTETLDVGRTVDEAERARRIAAVVSADDEVDTYLRHIEGFLAVEALRR